jgi:tellurite resistance protein
MEVLVPVLFCLFVLWLISKNGESADTPVDPSSSTGRVPPAPPSMASTSTAFSLKAMVKSQDVGGTSMKCLCVEASGVIPPAPGGTHQFLHLFDISAGGEEKKMVLAAIDQLQEELTTVFQFAPTPAAPPGSAFVDGGEFLTVPLDLLIPPRGGERTLLVKLSCCASTPRANFTVAEHVNGGRILGTATTSIRVQYWESGYEDPADSRKKAVDCAIQLAMVMAAADGELDRREGNVVRSWLKKMHGLDGDEDEKGRLNGLVRSSGKKALAGELKARHVLGELKKHTTDAFSLEVVDLCAEILAADGRASSTEMTLVDEIIDGLGLDRKSTRSLIDKRIMRNDIELDHGSNPYSMLSVQEGMDPAEIKKRLLNEFKRWNARTTHKDPNIRERAIEMLALIGKAREELV